MTTSTFIRRAVALIVALSAFAATFAMTMSTAHARPIRGATCVKTGNAVGYGAVRMRPNLVLRIPSGSRRVLRHPFLYSEWHAYAGDARESATQQFTCSARGGVDKWLAWRNVNGRTVARFDGVTIHALRPTFFAAWIS